MNQNELEHYGIMGMKWGIRRYQNEDGSLTDAGRKRYGVLTERYNKAAKSAHQTYSRATDMVNKANTRVSKADEKLHKFNAKLGYEAPHTDKNPLKGQQPNQQQNNVPKPQGEQKQAPQAPQQNQQPQQPKPQPQAQQPSNQNSNPSPGYWNKPISAMSDSELRAYADRLANQQRINNILNPPAPASSQQVKEKAAKGDSFIKSKGKKFGNKVVDTMVESAGKRIGDYYLDKLMGDAFKVDKDKKKD